MATAGLVPVALAEDAGLRRLADRQLSVPTDKGLNAGLKIMSLVMGMIAGADSIDDMAILRHDGMRRLFKGINAPSTLGSFLRKFTFGHVRQLDSVASRFLRALTHRAPVLANLGHSDDYVLVDINAPPSIACREVPTIVDVHGYGKQGLGYGYSEVRGVNALIGTVSTAVMTPIIIGQRMRKGAVNSVRVASHLVADLSITARLDPAGRAAIASIDPDSWPRIEYTRPVFDDETGELVSRAEVAETPFIAFRSKKKSERPMPESSPTTGLWTRPSRPDSKRRTSR